MRTCHSWHNNTLCSPPNCRQFYVFVLVFAWLLMWRTKRTTMEHEWHDDTRSLNLIIKSKRKRCGFSCVCLCADAIYLLNNREILSPSPMLRIPVMSVTHCQRPTYVLAQREDYAWNTFENNHAKIITIIGDLFYFETSFYIITLHRNNFGAAQQNADKTKINQNKTETTDNVSAQRNFR